MLEQKNLPDAIKWHFAYFWKHAISKDQLKNTIRSKKILENISQYQFTLN